MLDPRSLEVMVVTSGAFGPGRDHVAIARSAIEGGASSIQLRAPELSDEELLPLAADLALACRVAGVLFVVNDRLDVAMASESDGVHLGQDDDPHAARRRIGSGRVLGVSVGDVREALTGADIGADYLGVTVWATPTKPNATPRGLKGLHEVVLATNLPVVGIGGIFATNAELVLDAGAKGFAVVSAVAAAPDPVAATRSLVGVVRRFRDREGVSR